jgi:hypothetical protein
MLVGDVQRQGKSGAALVEAVLPTLNKNYGQWDFFAFLAEANIRDMEAELSGKNAFRSHKGDTDCYRLVTRGRQAARRAERQTGASTSDRCPPRLWTSLVHRKTMTACATPIRRPGRALAANREPCPRMC